MNRRMLKPGDSEWPERLENMGPLDAPKGLRAEGLPLHVPERTIAIVGTRHPSASGVDVTRTITRGLVEAEFTIVSGLALGIDSVAHRTALEVGGYTVAVLGCGLDIPYPQRNRSLREQIVRSGTVLSEYPDDARPTTFTFPRRNRIIAGLSAAVLFVEGGERSGGRITARFALDAGRHVFAIPGSVRSPMSVGPNLLIRRSQATLVTQVQDVLDELAPGLIWEQDRSSAVNGRVAGLDEGEKLVLRYLEEQPVKPERIRADLELSLGETALALARLEARGWVLRQPRGFGLTEAGVRMREGLSEAIES